jgi:hypothetical protein
MMDLLQWLQGVEGHKSVPLFDLGDNLAVKIKYVGSRNRPILKRHPQMEQAIIDLNVEASAARSARTSGTFARTRAPSQDGATTLFESPGSTRLVQPVLLYIAPWYTYSKGPSGNVCSVKQITQELIGLAYTQFTATLLNVHRG